MQDIGREVGISAEAVANAARSLDTRRQAGARTVLGLPIGVERTIALDRELTESEWERLVVELREVFKVRGSVSSSGSFRQWTNGNLQALLEPTASGHRLRLSTVKGNVTASMLAGSAVIGVGVILAIVGAATGHLGAVVPQIAISSLLGGGIVAVNALRLPGWARLRANQYGCDHDTARTGNGLAELGARGNGEVVMRVFVAGATGFVGSAPHYFES